MDKGLDIDVLRRVLAYHSALYGAGRSAANAVSQYRQTLKTIANSGAFLPPLIARFGDSGVKPRWDLADRALKWEESPDHHLISVDDACYPVLLREIAVPPPVLFVAGSVEFLTHAQIAIVGSRKATKPGCEFATDIACELAAFGLVITSGLAFGIDACAHRGALKAGVTIAVLGCGIDRIYPSRHQGLALEISSSGAVVSEFPLGAPPRKHHFPQRNRIISGLARGTIVVEAAKRSGSISTAMHAAEQGREVFAVPGSPRNPMSKGCHLLIAQGAKLIECALDVVDECTDLPLAVPPALTRTRTVVHANPDAASLGSRETEAFEACGWEPFTMDQIISHSGLTAQDVSSMLLTLELVGRIATHAAGTYIRIR